MKTFCEDFATDASDAVEQNGATSALHLVEGVEGQPQGTDTPNASADEGHGGGGQTRLATTPTAASWGRQTTTKHSQISTHFQI